VVYRRRGRQAQFERGKRQSEVAGRQRALGAEPPPVGMIRRDCPRWVVAAGTPAPPVSGGGGVAIPQPAAHPLKAADPDRGQRAAAVRGAELIEVGGKTHVGRLELLQPVELVDLIETVGGE